MFNRAGGERSDAASAARGGAKAKAAATSRAQTPGKAKAKAAFLTPKVGLAAPRTAGGGAAAASSSSPAPRIGRKAATPVQQRGASTGTRTQASRNAKGAGRVGIAPATPRTGIAAATPKTGGNGPGAASASVSSSPPRTPQGRLAAYRGGASGAIAGSSRTPRQLPLDSPGGLSASEEPWRAEEEPEPQPVAAIGRDGIVPEGAGAVQRPDRKSVV